MIIYLGVVGVLDGGSATAPDPPVARVGVSGVRVGAGDGMGSSSSMETPDMEPPAAPPRLFRAFFF